MDQQKPTITDIRIRFAYPIARARHTLTAILLNAHRNTSDAHILFEAVSLVRGSASPWRFFGV